MKFSAVIVLACSYLALPTVTGEAGKEIIQKVEAETAAVAGSLVRQATVGESNTASQVFRARPFGGPFMSDLIDKPERKMTVSELMRVYDLSLEEAKAAQMSTRTRPTK